MACLKLLKTVFISGGDAGGVWTYTGPSPITIIITGISGTTTLNPGDIIDPGNDDPELDFETLTGLACGQTYTNALTYTVTSGGCDDSEAIDIIVTCPPDAGTDLTVTYCETDPIVNIYDLIGATDTTGTWTGTGLANPGYAANTGVPTDDTFDPSASGVVAGLTFIYTVQDTATDCPCPDDVKTLTVSVEAAPDAGTGANASICI